LISFFTIYDFPRITEVNSKTFSKNSNEYGSISENKFGGPGEICSQASAKLSPANPLFSVLGSFQGLFSKFHHPKKVF
jgi:hypothetical protein